MATVLKTVLVEVVAPVGVAAEGLVVAPLKGLAGLVAVHGVGREAFRVAAGQEEDEGYGGDAEDGAEDGAEAAASA